MCLVLQYLLLQVPSQSKVKKGGAAQETQEAEVRCTWVQETGSGYDLTKAPQIQQLSCFTHSGPRVLLKIEVTFFQEVF